MNNMDSVVITGNGSKLTEYAINKEDGKVYKRTITRSGVNGFSGTDLRANIDHPGVCFPLNEGENQPNFAGIMQHKQDFSEIIRTEYRIFNGKEGSDKVYKKGRCLTVVRGYETEEPEPEAPLEDGPIDAIFGTTRPKPKPKPPEKKREDYLLKDGLTGTEGDSIGFELMEMWKNCEFEIDTSMILKENIIYGKRRLPGKPKLQTSIYDYWEETAVNEVNSKLPKEKKFVDRSHVWAEAIEKKAMELVEYLNYSEDEIRSYTAREVLEAYDLEKIDLEEEKELISIEHKEKIQKAKTILVGDNIISKEKLDMMNDDDIIKIFEESYSIDFSILEDMVI